MLLLTPCCLSLQPPLWTLIQQGALLHRLHLKFEYLSSCLFFFVVLHYSSFKNPNLIALALSCFLAFSVLQNVTQVWQDLLSNNPAVSLETDWRHWRNNWNTAYINSLLQRDFLFVFCYQKFFFVVDQLIPLWLFPRCLEAGAETTSRTHRLLPTWWFEWGKKSHKDIIAAIKGPVWQFAWVELLEMI